MTLKEVNLPVALERLKQQGRIIWPEVSGDRKPRPGMLAADPATDSEGLIA